MQFSEYNSEDKPACQAIFESNIPKYFTPEEWELFKQWLDKKDRAPYHVLEVDGEIVACGGIYDDPEKNCAGLAWGMVANQHHGKGYGKALTEMRLNLIRELFPGKVIRNETSQHTVAFYEKFGFETQSIEPNGFGGGIDKYLMEMQG